MTMTIETGTKATSLLREAAFQRKWNALYHQCPWATPFQGVGFVTTWYDVYQARYQPVIVSQVAPDGELVGLLTLAVTTDAKQLVVAGTHQAEYQVWLAQPQAGDVFIEDAMTQLRREFPGQALGFTYLPPQTPLEWTNPERRQGPYCYLEKHRRPLMLLGDRQQLAEPLRKKSNRDRLKRLKNLGDVCFEQLKEASELASIFDEIITYYDFRQGAINNSYPFQNDPLKKPFYLALMRVPNVLHVTVLKLQNSMIAAHLGVCDKELVYVGIPVHSPFYAPYSPGIVQIFLLGQEMVNQGFVALDLTPGGDAWKERFATNYEDVRILTVFSTRRELIRLETGRQLMTSGKRILQFVGVAPQTLKNWGESLRRITTTRAVWQRFKALGGKSEVRLYVITAEAISKLEQAQSLARDRLEDLLLFQGAGYWQTRQEVLSLALQRLEKGSHVYTYAEHGALWYSGWLTKPQETIVLPEGEYAWNVPSGSVVLFDFYLRPRANGDDYYQAALRQMLPDAAAMPGVTQVYLPVPVTNRLLQHAVEAVGGTYAGSLFKPSVVGKLKQWITKQSAEVKS